MTDRDARGISRRALLKMAAAAELGAVASRAAGQTSPAPARPGRRPEVAAYLEGLARPDGGYSWPGHPDSHLSPTFAAIGCYHVLDREPPAKEKLIEFVREHHPSRLRKLEQEHREFDYQQIQGLLWLGADASTFRDRVRGWKVPTPYLPQYERHRYPVFRSELTAFTCRALLGLPLDDLASAYVGYLDARRRPDGSFNNTPAADGGPGHVLNTWWGLRALDVLGRAGERRDEAVAWLRACQLPGGGFTYRPGADVGGVDDVAYTWAAVRALRLLDAGPADRGACVRYLQSLANPDGGSGDRPGWSSNPMATCRALDALDALGALGADTSAVPRRSAPRRVTSLPDDLRAFTIQIEAHGQGSPREAVALARALKIHLWGAKNAKPAWIARARAVAEQEGVPVTFLAANEEYGTWVDVPGLGTYSHTSDVIAPAGSDFGPSLAGPTAASWPEFRERRLAPLQKAGGRLIWQFGENEELVRIFLDDSLERGGYAAISTFHFGNPDFTNTEPFLDRYRGRIPFVALQDAHGAEPWWFADNTEGFRTVFLAREPTWEGWLEALAANRVVAVRHDAVSGFRTWMHGGSPEVLDFVRRRDRDWRWWDNPEIRRPPVSLVALTPADEFEAGRPERGVTLRVRCAWENTPQGLPRSPIVELVTLIVDGEAVTPTLVAKTRPGRAVPDDPCHHHPMPDIAPGRHTARAVVRGVKDKAESEQSIEFII